MAVSITNTRIAALNTSQALTFNAATADTAGATEVFTYTPTGKDHKVLIGIQVANSNGPVSYSIAGGAGVFGTAAKTGSVAQGTTGVIQIETGRYMSASGTIAITFTPASGKKLLTDHALKVWVAELQ
jgi:hypothetical protein